MSCMSCVPHLTVHSHMYLVTFHLNSILLYPKIALCLRNRKWGYLSELDHENKKIPGWFKAWPGLKFFDVSSFTSRNPPVLPHHRMQCTLYWYGSMGGLVRIGLSSCHRLCEAGLLCKPNCMESYALFRYYLPKFNEYGKRGVGHDLLLL